jgi:hypothetical protein
VSLSLSLPPRSRPLVDVLLLGPPSTPPSFPLRTGAEDLRCFPVEPELVAAATRVATSSSPRLRRFVGPVEVEDVDDDDDGGDFPGAPRDMGGKHIADQHMVVTCYIWRFFLSCQLDLKRGRETLGS